MGRHLSSASVLLRSSFCPWPSVGAERRRLPSRTDWERGRSRPTAAKRARESACLDAEHFQSTPPKRVSHLDINPSGAPMPRDAELSRHNLVFGGIAKTHDHDAVMPVHGHLVPPARSVRYR